ncbi:hypothetical protein EX30DRAFT_337453 [Ascodesmis nigricans]|uniref:Peroxin 20 n=1 Tax=Ascodesmis nigricans TaxID=341454 RepID=A0A4S2N6Y6_9PEZI|nr:hypothetical protein EX30DRAFT_337453 [Ascodesmis nigricans]
MSGSLCGPSNALQSLTKHTSVDRSLQRDRLAPNRSQTGTPLSGFRSAPSHINPQADHEFAAFTTSQPGPALNHFQPAPTPQFAPARHQTPQENWANDFSRLELGPAQPVLRSKGSAFLNAGPSFQNAGPATQWRSEFTATRAEPSAAFAAQSMMPMMQQPAYTPAFQSYSQMPMQSSGMGEQQNKLQDDFQFDDSAFESAFEMAAQQLHEAAANNVGVEMGEREALAQAVEEVQPVEQQEEEERSKEQDGDELARTAGQLLESVKGDSSEKFQKSNFLALMRKLRDHEVVIQGDTMVEVG